MDAPAYKKVQLNEEYCEENYGEELVELIQNQCKDEDAYNRNTDEFQQRFKDVVA